MILILKGWEPWDGLASEFRVASFHRHCHPLLRNVTCPAVDANFYLPIFSLKTMHG